MTAKIGKLKNNPKTHSDIESIVTKFSNELYKTQS